MYIALMVKNYDTNPEVVMFTHQDHAINYLKWWWNKEYEEAKAKCPDKLYPAECYCENEYAKIEWTDNATIEFFVAKDSEPQWTGNYLEIIQGFDKELN